MNHRLLDALDLIKMLEVVFEQRQALELNGENHGKSNTHSFPWSGVRLTLRQARELLQDIGNRPANLKEQSKSSSLDSGQLDSPFNHPNAPRMKPNKEQSNGELGDKNYRGTFNRIQLTQEPQTASSEEKMTPVTR